MVTISRALPRAPSVRSYVKRLESQAIELAHRVLAVLYRWDGAYRDSLKLREMDGRLLEDIGLSRRQAEQQADKLLWRV